MVFETKPNTQSLQAIEQILISIKKEQKDHAINKVQEYKNLYEEFMESKTLKEIIGIFGNFKTIHSYSLRNLCLCYIQAQDRNMKDYVGILNSFANWKKLAYSVKRGEKGLDILVPTPRKIKKKDDTKTQTSGEEEKEKIQMYFKFKLTFDISQATAYDDYKKEQEALNEKVYKNAEIDYDTARDFIKTHFPQVKIIEDFKEQECKGELDYTHNKLYMYERTSATLFHEIGHYITMELNITFGDWRYNLSSKAKNEILAELSCYLLTKCFDENLEYNFNYSNVWAGRITQEFEIKEFGKAYKQITNFFSKLF